MKNKDKLDRFLLFTKARQELKFLERLTRFIAHKYINSTDYKNK